MGNPWEIHGIDGYKWRFIAVNFIVWKWRIFQHATKMITRA
jgi:hypothetical protein